MEKLLEGKLCIVSGAARGMGKAVALKYARHGANVALMDLNKDGIKAAAEEIEQLGVKALPFAINVASSQEVDNAIKEIEAKFTTIDVLANCAGILTAGLMVDVAESDWDRVLNVNLKSVYLLSRRVAQNMIRNKVKNGKIVSISSQASKLGEVGNGPYCVSKAGVNMLTQVLGLELAEHGISVNAICPGLVNTEMAQQLFMERGPLLGMTAEEFTKMLSDAVPAKRLADPDEIAEFMLFLSSEKANYITGVALTIAGGRATI